MLADKGGIIITSDPMTSNGKVQVSVDLGKKHHVIGFHIVNRSPSCINFTYYTAISRIHHPCLEDERKVSRVNPVLLFSGKPAFTICSKIHQNLPRRYLIIMTHALPACSQRRVMTWWFTTNWTSTVISPLRCSLSSSRTCQRRLLSTSSGR